jgi:hypothetical protein
MEEIKVAALELTPPAREALAEALLLSLTPDERDDIDAAWLAEVHQRDASPDDASERDVFEAINSLRRRA